MQELADMHDVNTGHQGQWRVIGVIKHIGRRQEHCAQGVAVTEKVVAETNEFGTDVDADRFPEGTPSQTSLRRS